MDDLKLIFAANLIRLRQSAGLTQAALAEKVSYSDKSVSKWERGEAIPDAYVLKSLAALFHVTVDELLTEHDEWEKPGADLKKKVSYSQLFVILCSIAAVVTLCFLEFILVWVIVDQFHWIVLYAALPVSLILLLVLNTVWYKGRNNMYIVMALVFSLIFFLYLLSIWYGSDFWQFLLMILPAELIVFFAYHIKPRKIHLKRRKNKGLSES